MGETVIAIGSPLWIEDAPTPELRDDGLVTVRPVLGGEES